MKYIIKNKIISWGAGSTVRDESDKDLYFVKGKVFTLSKKKFIRDMDKNVLYIVHNKIFHLLLPKVFVCDKDGNKLLMIKKKKLFGLKQNFEIVPMSDSAPNWQIMGDIIARNFSIVENNDPIAHVRKNFNLIKDSFWLETVDERAPLLIAFVIAIDNYYDKLMGQER
jgi:uncharacterized protein YxjI